MGGSKGFQIIFFFFIYIINIMYVIKWYKIRYLKKNKTFFFGVDSKKNFFTLINFLFEKRKIFKIKCYKIAKMKFLKRIEKSTSFYIQKKKKKKKNLKKREKTPFFFLQKKKKKKKKKVLALIPLL